MFNLGSYFIVDRVAKVYRGFNKKSDVFKTGGGAKGSHGGWPKSRSVRRKGSIQC